MNILIASASAVDARYFPVALGDQQVTLVEGEPTGNHPEVEALAIVHGRSASRRVLDAMPNLRLIVTRSTGYDHIDLAEAKRRGITVCNVPEYGSTTVAEFTFGLILSLSRRIPQAVAASRTGRFSVDGFMGVDLAGKTLGIVGLGKIGRNLAKMARGFDMKVVAYDPYKEDSVSLDAVFESADFVALCCPLTDQTRHLVNRYTLGLMKPSAFLLNTARGPVVDSEALLEAINSGRLAGAALDVLEGEEFLQEFEPDISFELSHALMNNPKVLVTPHLAYDSAEALGRIRETTKDILLAFAAGTTLNAVQVSTDVPTLVNVR